MIDSDAKRDRDMYAALLVHDHRNGATGNNAMRQRYMAAAAMVEREGIIVIRPTTRMILAGIFHD